MKNLIFLFLLVVLFSCSKNEYTVEDVKTDAVVVEEGLSSDDCIWIDYNSRSYFDGVDNVLYLDENIYKTMDERVHNGAKIILIDITGVIFYEGTVADVLNGYTAELNIDAPTMSDGEMSGCILVYQ